MTQEETVSYIVDYAKTFVRECYYPRITEYAVCIVVCNFVDYYAKTSSGIELSLSPNKLKFSEEPLKRFYTMEKYVVIGGLKYYKELYNNILNKDKDLKCYYARNLRLSINDVNFIIDEFIKSIA